MAITQTDIARRIGISPQAVAYALSERPELRRKISRATHRRVLEAARNMGYVPHQAARRLARARAGGRAPSFDQVGMIYLAGAQEAFDPIFVEMLRGAEQELFKLHATLLFVRAAELGDWEKVDRIARGGGVDGWLVVGQVDDAVARRLQAGGLPFVVLGDHRCRSPIHAVTADYVAASRLAIQHLAALGHRRVGYLGGSMTREYQIQFRAAFFAARDDLGLDADGANLVADASIWRLPSGEGTSEKVIEWLRRQPRPTALFATELDAVVSITRVLKPHGIEIPRDLSVVGCAFSRRTPESQDSTCVDIPMVELGRQGARLLQQLVCDPGPHSSDIRITPTLIAGNSTSSPTPHLRRTP